MQRRCGYFHVSANVIMLSVPAVDCTTRHGNMHTLGFCHAVLCSAGEQAFGRRREGVRM
jgi:hypothetical protein